MSYFVFKVAHEIFLTVTILFLFFTSIYSFVKKNNKDAFVNSACLVLFLVSLYLIFPWKKITILYFNYFWFLLFIFISAILILLKSFSRNIFSNSSPREKIISFILLLIFGILDIVSFASSSGSTRDIAEIELPFKSGEYFVAQGGNNPLINYHYLYYAQKYALDITKNCPKEKNFSAKILNNEDFCIWNEPLVAVCDGVVKDAVDVFKDNIPTSEIDKRNYKGNHVELHCNSGVDILYAHMRLSSVLVKKGDLVIKGKQIGNVGNSGNSTEPHLHIQANLNKAPLVMKFNGHSYKRNDLIKI